MHIQIFDGLLTRQLLTEQAGKKKVHNSVNSHQMPLFRVAGIIKGH